MPINVSLGPERPRAFACDFAEAMESSQKRELVISTASVKNGMITQRPDTGLGIVAEGAPRAQTRRRCMLALNLILVAEP
jgi:hypothetical protein